MQNEPSAGPTRRSARGLDWFVFFVADIQTGFGPFVAVYLTEQKWTQIDIPLLLPVGGGAARAAASWRSPGGCPAERAWTPRARSVGSLAAAWRPSRLAPWHTEYRP